ncbi:MAG: hypothetical protein BWY83_02416 [bacterium ADurb.Bin478]|nr:MAG: hypothetical protein BWY83_02416 [bacterium ADurb.Bin478]
MQDYRIAFIVSIAWLKKCEAESVTAYPNDSDVDLSVIHIITKLAV